MAHRYPEHYIQTGERVTPIELNAELAILASEINGRLDRENFNPGKAGISDSRISAFAMNRLQINGTHVAQDIPLANAYAYTEWVELTGSVVSVYTSLDCVLVVEAGATWYHVAWAANEEQSRTAFGIKVDEEVYFEGWDQCPGRRDASHMDLAVPVAAGRHRVVPVMRLGRATRIPGVAYIGSALNVRILNSQCMVREAIR